MLLLARRAVVVFATWVGLCSSVACKRLADGDPSPKRSPAGALRTNTESVAPVSLPPFEPGNAESGRRLVAQFECHRCHEGTGLAAPSLDRDCVRCHEQIATDQFPATPAKLAKWKPHIMAYRDVPSLSALGRLRPSWVMAYLLNPQDVRPSLVPSMPRLNVTAAQARDVATYLTQGPATVAVADLLPATGAQIERGRELMSSRACTSCHHMTGSSLPTPPAVDVAPRSRGLAIDLRFARERSEPAALVQWLMDPARVKHDAAMPNLGLTTDDARDLAAFLTYAPLAARAVREPPARLPMLNRRVGFDEVSERVFAVTCRHCHTDADSAGGDGGPGNTGGFGFAPRKIDFSSYRGIQSGGVDGNGERVSLFAPSAEGLPRLIAALVARQREEAGLPTNGVRGMPLGLPALTAEQIQLVETWVEQGRPL